MACGNEGDEGEGAKTWDSLMVTAYATGYDAGSWKETSVTEKSVKDFSATFTLDVTYPLGTGCLIDISWTNSNFLPSYVQIDGNIVLYPSTSTSSYSYTLTSDIPSSLLIEFKDTFVAK
jgi:hypothetical protein